MKRILQVFALITLLFASVSPSFATNTRAGTVKSIQGSALAVQNAMVRPLKIGDDILIGDILSTGSDSRLEITMIDDGAFQLGAQTSFVVIDYTFGQGAGSAVLNLLQGAVDGASGQLAKLNPQGMEIQTPLATVGIRGTKFFVGDIDGTLNVAHWSGGGVSVKTDGGSVFMDQAGVGTQIIEKDTPPSEPKKWSKELVQKAKALVQ